MCKNITDELKNVVIELKDVIEILKNSNEELKSNIQKKSVIEIASRDFIKTVSGDSGVGNNPIGCDNTQKIKVVDSPIKEKKPYSKTKITMWIIGICGVVAAIAEVVKAFF